MLDQLLYYTFAIFASASVYGVLSLIEWFYKGLKGNA